MLLAQLILISSALTSLCVFIQTLNHQCCLKMHLSATHVGRKMLRLHSAVPLFRHGPWC